MDVTTLIETWGDGAVLAMAGLGVGLLFGALAQRSKFCFRAAAIETARGAFGSRLAIWLIAFATAIAVTQGLIAAGWLNVAEARQIAGQGSISGALIGGLMFGVGMIMARGCASRLLVLSATGNLRALISGLILTLVAQASLRGALSPAREAGGNWWVVPAGGRRAVLAARGG
ncbi:MAG: YeeE/YedE thiosulfate transporter family protein, partial [Hyphomicrobiaceae bacterium]